MFQADTTDGRISPSNHLIFCGIQEKVYDWLSDGLLSMERLDIASCWLQIGVIVFGSRHPIQQTYPALRTSMPLNQTLNMTMYAHIYHGQNI
jgi:hypothetical protein